MNWPKWYLMVACSNVWSLVKQAQKRVLSWLVQCKCMYVRTLYSAYIWTYGKYYEKTQKNDDANEKSFRKLLDRQVRHKIQISFHLSAKMAFFPSVHALQVYVCTYIRTSNGGKSIMDRPISQLWQRKAPVIYIKSSLEPVYPRSRMQLRSGSQALAVE